MADNTNNGCQPSWLTGTVGISNSLNPEREEEKNKHCLFVSSLWLFILVGAQVSLYYVCARATLGGATVGSYRDIVTVSRPNLIVWRGKSKL